MSAEAVQGDRRHALHSVTGEAIVPGTFCSTPDALLGRHQRSCYAPAVTVARSVALLAATCLAKAWPWLVGAILVTAARLPGAQASSKAAAAHAERCAEPSAAAAAQGVHAAAAACLIAAAAAAAEEVEQQGDEGQMVGSGLHSCVCKAAAAPVPAQDLSGPPVQHCLQALDCGVELP